MDDYRVRLDVFCGPLDLLLYLVRKSELDITAIRISEITEQYLRYVEMLRHIDPDAAGDFLLVAATLMEIKSRELIPAVQVEETPAEAESADRSAGDPRQELIRQLLEYKEFKDRAVALERQLEDASRRHPRVPAELGGQPDVDLGDVSAWDLLTAFEKVIAQVRLTHQHDVVDDDTPISLHMEDIADRLTRDGPLAFMRLFEGRSKKGEVIGLFLAVLELCKQRRLKVTRQSSSEDEAVLMLEIVEATAEDAAEPTEPRPPADLEPDSVIKPKRRRPKFTRDADDDAPADGEPVDATEAAIAFAEGVLERFRMTPEPGSQSAMSPVETDTAAPAAT